MFGQIKSSNGANDVDGFVVNDGIVDCSKFIHQLVDNLSLFKQVFIHPRRCKMCSINSTTTMVICDLQNVACLIRNSHRTCCLI